ncbi:MAG: hypothetical protein BGO98_46190 [Myxococcales bacterium 68-20]|nr:MAG: hypothetical protein BGO98_46190 [Myxococcales bacterium 68-20]
MSARPLVGTGAQRARTTATSFLEGPDARSEPAPLEASRFIEGEAVTWGIDALGLPIRDIGG